MSKMTLEQALRLCYVDWPRNNKLKCPYHPEKDGSLHLYRKTDSWTCFSCGATGDGYGLLSALTGQPIGDVLKEHTKGEKVTAKPAKAYLYRDRLQREGVIVTEELFRLIRDNERLEPWQKQLLAERAGAWWDEKKQKLFDMSVHEMERAVDRLHEEVVQLIKDWSLEWTGST